MLVENSPHAYGYQIENGISIESWFEDDNDTELLKLVGLLRKAFAGNIIAQENATPTAAENCTDVVTIAIGASCRDSNTSCASGSYCVDRTLINYCGPCWQVCSIRWRGGNRHSRSFSSC